MVALFVSQRRSRGRDMTPRIGYFYKSKYSNNLVAVSKADSELVTFVGVNCVVHIGLSPEQFLNVYTEYNP